MTTLPPSYEQSIKRSKKPMMAPDCFPRPVTVNCGFCKCEFNKDELTECSICHNVICSNCIQDEHYKFTDYDNVPRAYCTACRGCCSDSDSETTDVCNTCNCDFDTSELTICSNCCDTICDNCNDNSFKYSNNFNYIIKYYCESCYPGSDSD